MEVDPPYLLDCVRYADRGVSIIRRTDAAVIEIAVHGQWTLPLCLDVHAVLRKCTAEHPEAIIVDLQNLNDLDAASANLWLAAARAANRLRPPAQLVLSLPPTRQLTNRLRQLGAVRYLPMFPGMQQARVAVASRTPLTERLQLSGLLPEPDSISTATGLVTVACDAWRLASVLNLSQLVMSELATNAVKHTGTDLAVTVSRRGTGIYLAVHDGDPRLPHLPGPVPPAPGTGLRMVHAQSSAWGAMPTQDGKVVWAIVRSGRRALR